MFKPVYISGELPERFMGAVLKTARPSGSRGFESPTLRYVYRIAKQANNLSRCEFWTGLQALEKGGELW
jgi:hypothetical protein